MMWGGNTTASLWDIADGCQTCGDATPHSGNILRLVVTPFVSIEERNHNRSLAAHAVMVQDSRERRATGVATKQRHGFQQMARLPCYRGVRAR